MVRKRSVLNDPVLVLNKFWQLTAVTDIRDSMRTIFTGKSRVVDTSDYSLWNWASWGELDIPDGELYVATSSKPPFSRIRMPEVILLWEYARLPTRSLSFSRHHVFKRDHFICQYCGSHPGKGKLQREDMTIDHVLPKSRGGITEWKNCVCACLDCNSKKADKTPEEAGMELIKKPKKPNWSPQEAVVRVGNSGMKESWQHFMDK